MNNKNLLDIVFSFFEWHSTTVLPRDPVLLDQALRHMPRALRLRERIPDDEVDAQQARVDFYRWWYAWRAILAEEHTTGGVALESAPYYGAESCVLVPGGARK